jgi:hypothetical protein
MVTGGFRTRQAMEEAVSSGETDVVGLARPLCLDPALPRRLIEGAVDQAQSPERDLRLGPGRLLGPASPVFLLKFLNVQGEVAWFYRQIIRLAGGDAPNPGLGLGRALLQHLRDEIRISRGRTFRADG